MARKTHLRILGLASVGLWAAACGGPGAGDEVELTTANLVTSNALSMNALSMNALSMNALSMNALSMNALSMNALVSSKLTDPLAREFLKYVVSCALPDDASFDLSIGVGRPEVLDLARTAPRGPDDLYGRRPRGGLHGAHVGHHSTLRTQI